MGNAFVDRFHKGSLYSFIVFLAVTAVFAIVCVISGDFGEFEMKVILTSAIIALASICSLCCGAFSQRTGHHLLAVVGVVLAYVGGALAITALWGELDSKPYLKIMGITCIYAVATAHSFALLAVRFKGNHRYIQSVTVAIIFLLATIISIMIIAELNEDEQALFKLIAVLAILAALGTLVIPILNKIGKAVQLRSVETITLTRRDDGMYVSGDQRVFELREIEQQSINGPVDTSS